MKLYKVTLSQYKTLQQNGSISVGGVTYDYDENNIYVVIDPWAPEYRLEYKDTGDVINLTKDGGIVSTISVRYADTSDYSTVAHTLKSTRNTGDGGTSFTAESLREELDNLVTTSTLTSTISATVSSINKTTDLIETEIEEHVTNKSNPHGVTKSQIGLGSVVNAGQTATPASGSNSYFTAGGAYTLQQNLNNSIEDATLQANQQWGGPDIAGSLSPVEVVATPTVGANKLAFCNTNGVTIEYSINGGSTWNDYQATESQITNFFNGRGSNFILGKKGETVGSGSVQDKLRITLDATAMGVYFRIKRLLINVSTNGTSGLHVDIERATIGAPDTFASVRTNISLNG